MKFNLKRPCKDCPFRTDIHPYLNADRVREITDALMTGNSTFACHETTEYNEEEGDMASTKDSSHCAGAMIFLEVQEIAIQNQMVRIAERLRIYDHKKLDMSAPVFHDQQSMIDHHGGKR